MRFKLLRITILASVALFFTITNTSAQYPEFLYWIIANDHVGDTTTMLFGNSIYATYCLDDGTNGTINLYEASVPPPPPSGWDIRWKGVRTAAGNACIIDGLFPRDFRAVPLNPERKDTFKLTFGNLDVPDSSISLTWPESSYLSSRCDSMYFTYTDPITSTLVKVNMMTQNSWDIPQATVNFGFIFITIYKFGVGLVGVDDPGTARPYTIILEQNYPNPFNPTTSIVYHLDSRSHVRLSVYDLLGRELVQLVDEEENPGRKSVTFDGSSLTSGIYFYRLEAGRFVEARKFVILK